MNWTPEQKAAFPGWLYRTYGLSFSDDYRTLDPEEQWSHEEEFENSFAAQQKRRQFDPWKVQGIEEMLTKAEEPWKYVIDEVLLDQSALMQSGKPHSMKSLGWLASCLGTAIDQKVWNRYPTTVNRALFIETEDPEQVVAKRVQQLAKGYGLLKNTNPDGIPQWQLAKKLPSGFRFIRPGPFDLVKDGGGFLKRILDREKPGFMVLSTLQGLLAGRDWKEQKDMSPVNSLIVSLAHDYCPIVLISHSPQDTASETCGRHCDAGS